MIIRRAVSRLTVRYSLIILGAIALFAIGVAVYVAFAFEVQLPEASASEEAIDRANTALRVGLIACFVVLALLVPPLSYLLARSTLAPVRENLEAQQRFVDDASHELRTPLAVAQGELELSLMQPRTPEQYRETIEDALEALAELGTLTGDLLLLARTDRLEDGAESVSFHDLAQRAVLALSPDSRQRVTVQASTKHSMKCVPDLLIRAISNLLENALKFSPQDTQVMIAIIRSDQQNGGTRITVTDSGIGMSEFEASQAFDRFWRADAARRTPGHGIGLSIVKRIAEYHGGSVALRSAPGVGTRAIIELPRSQNS